MNKKGLEQKNSFMSEDPKELQSSEEPVKFGPEPEQRHIFIFLVFRLWIISKLK